jgi:predicted RND superfamily exporter protein
VSCEDSGNSRFSGNAWIAWLGQRTGTVLGVGTLLSLMSLWCFTQYGALNSDLSKLIKPSESLSWYRNNEAYKAAFPQLQQTAVIVARSDDYGQLQGYVRELAERLPMDTVFAPGVDPFIVASKPYFLSVPQLREWLDGASYNQGSLLRLMDEASLANALFTYADFVSANPGQILPISLQSVLDGLADGDLDFKSHYPLEPEGGGHVELILVSAKQRLDTALPNAAIVSALQRTLEEYPPPDSVEVALTGEVVLAHEEMSAALSGIERAGLVSLIFLLCIVALGIRSGPILAAISTMLAMGICLTLGFATLAVGELNTLSMIFVVLFFGLGVDFAAHFTLRVQADLDQELGTALGQALRDTGPALALCTLTSAVSFLAFLPTAYRGLAELGVISAGGIVIAFVLTLSIIPAVLLRWPPVPRKPVEKAGFEAVLGRMRSGVDAIPDAWVVGVFVALAMSSLWMAKDLRFDYSVLAMRDAQSPAMQALLALQQDQQTTDYSVHVLADDADAAAQLKEELLRLPSVSAVSTPGGLRADRAKGKERAADQAVCLAGRDRPTGAARRGGHRADDPCP